MEVLCRLLQIRSRGACPGVGIDHWKIQLILSGFEIDKEIVDFVQHLRHARVACILPLETFHCASWRRAVGYSLVAIRSDSARRHE